MKEFKDNIVIRFRSDGKTIRQRIDADKVNRDTEKRRWTFLFWRDGIRYRVTGAIDADGDLRSRGPLDSDGNMAVLTVETTVPGAKHITGFEIVATDVPMAAGRMYVTLQIDYEREEDEDDGEVRQSIMSETDYGFSVGSHLPFRITGTEILGENLL